MSHISTKSEIKRIEEEMRCLQARLEALNSTVRDNQKAAANKILNYYCSTSYRYGLLRANEQVGKTGTYHYLIRRMFEKKIIDNAYILCGSNEIQLRTQCLEDVEEWHSDKPYYANIHVIFRQHFDDTTMNTTRALIIIDESHLVEGVDQTLNLFLHKHKLSMAGTLPHMVINNTYMLSVDATPYAEESAMEYKLSRDKFKVTLEDGEGYFGVKQYYENGLIYPTYNLAEPRGKYNFMMLLNKYKSKYILVRIQSKNKQKQWLTKWAELAGCDIINFTSEYEKASAQIFVTKNEADEHYKKYNLRVPSLEEAPKKTTVVIVDGRLRCGKRVPKKHIGFIWESTKKPKTDIIRQSLLGRMCGYKGEGIYNVPLENKPLIFIPELILKKPEINKVIHLSDIERSIYPNSNGTIIGPRFGNNIIPGRVQTKAIKAGNELTPCVPIRFNLNNEQTGSLSSSSELNTKSYCLDRLLSRLDLITNNHNLTEGQKKEILLKLETITANECHMRRYQDVSNQNMHKCHVDAYLDQTASKEHISDFHFITFCIVYPGFKQLESVKTVSKPGEVYAIFYTKAKGNVRNIHIESRVSKVNNATHFTIQATSELLDCAGGSIYGFSPKIKCDADNLLVEFDYFIECAKKNIGIFGKTFTALASGEHITLPRTIYGRNLETLKVIFSILEEKHGIKITYQVKKRLISSEACSDIELKYISWE
jgi:hypothetical protein